MKYCFKDWSQSNSSLASSADKVIFPSSLNPDPADQCCCGSKPFDTLIVLLKDFLLKVHFEKKVIRLQEKHEQLPSMQRVIAYKLSGGNFCTVNS